jgi:cell wall-associated NlpC family hydrolase
MPSPLAVIGIVVGSISLVAAVAGTTAVAVVSRAEGGGQLTCTTSASNGTSTSDSAASGGVAGFDADQMNNAAVIVAIGKQMDVPAPGWVVAITAALQESDLVNVDQGDRDSLGLFQERPSQGWGSPAQIMDPIYSSTQFYRHLLAVPRWQQLSVNDAAQAVERSGYPQAYGPHVPIAEKIVAAVAGAVCTSTGASAGSCTEVHAPNPVALAAVTFACQQLGVPYQWGGNGPADASLTAFSKARIPPDEQGFDCSGLTKAAYAAAGVTIPRTAQTQYNAGPHLPSGQSITAGDLVFFGTSSRAVTHVGIAISATDMIDAPHTGAVVRSEPIWRQDFVGVTRPSSSLGS